MLRERPVFLWLLVGPGTGRCGDPGPLGEESAGMEAGTGRDLGVQRP